MDNCAAQSATDAAGMIFSNNSLTLALLSFFSTTVDDFCVILIFFAREYVKTHSVSNADTALSFVKISIGQFVGFSIIVAVSLGCGIGLNSVVNNNYIDLIGILPVLIGLYKVYELMHEAGYTTKLYNLICCVKYTPIENIVEDPEGNHVSNISNTASPDNVMNRNKKPLYDEEAKDASGLEMKNMTFSEKTPSTDSETGTYTSMSSIPDNNDKMNIILNEESLDAIDSGVDKSNIFVAFVKRIFYYVDPLVFEVAVYALVFGTDNIAIYVALFSNTSLLETAGICLAFYFMLLMYLLVAILIIVQVNINLKCV